MPPLGPQPEKLGAMGADTTLPEFTRRDQSLHGLNCLSGSYFTSAMESIWTLIFAGSAEAFTATWSP